MTPNTGPRAPRYARTEDDELLMNVYHTEASFGYNPKTGRIIEDSKTLRPFSAAWGSSTTTLVSEEEFLASLPDSLRSRFEAAIAAK